MPERDTRGTREVQLWALKGTRYCSFWTRLRHGHRRLRGTRGTQEVHERGTRGVRERHERGTRGALMGTVAETLFFI